MGSLACWGTRDMMTVFSSFVLVDPVAAALNSRMPRDWVERNPQTILNATQFALPVAMQAFSTPFHLLGLDLFNRPTSIACSERWKLIRREYVSAMTARMLRISTAFGIGGVANRTIHQALERRFR